MNKYKQLLASLCLMATSVLALAQNNPIANVSAASFDPHAPFAANSIVAAFGARLATRTVSASGDADPNTPGIQLPTTLGGTTVEVNGVRAGLFFVAPTQVNYLIPEGTPLGTRNVVLRAEDGTVSNGTLNIATVAPGFFTANGNGRGVPAGVVLRIKANNEQLLEPLAQFNPALNSFTPRPFDLGAENERVFLLLFATGVRQRANLAEVRVFLGGEQLSVDYAGAQGTFAGLDQLNVPLPRTLLELAGRGQVDLSLTIGGTASQTTQIEIAPTTAGTQVRVTGYHTPNLLAGQTLLINGTGFSSDKQQNQVFITGADGQTTAQVIDANPTQLTVLVPFGSSSGVVKVSTTLGQADAPVALTIRPSLSGFIQDNERNAISGLLVRVLSTNPPITTRTDGNGFFFLPDLSGVSVDIELNGPDETPPLPFPKRSFKAAVKASGDRQLGYLELQRNSNALLANAPDGTFSNTRVVAAPADELQAQNQVVLEIPPGATVRFPPGTSGPLVLTVLDRGRTPSRLPPAHFSSTIAQITPFGATIAPGAKLTFPNTDAFPAGATVRLFRFDQSLTSPTLGTFIDAGPARVSADGRRVETDADAIKEASYFFVSLERRTTTVVGQVVESDQTPVRNTLVVVRGQEVFTDGNGIFILRNVPVNGTVAQNFGDAPPGAELAAQTDMLSVEGNVLRPTARVERARRDGFTPIVGGTTRTTDLALPPPPPNSPPVIQAQNVFEMSAGSAATLSFTVSDSNPGQTVRVEVTGANFLTLARGGGDLYLLRLTPAANQAGVYTLVITAIDNLGAVATRQIALTVR